CKMAPIGVTLEWPQGFGRSDHLPLSSIQEEIWSSELAGVNDSQVMLRTFLLEERVNSELFGRALMEVFMRHEVLGATFGIDELGRRFQRSAGVDSVPMVLIDLSQLDGAMSENAVSAVIEDLAQVG